MVNIYGFTYCYNITIEAMFTPFILTRNVTLYDKVDFIRKTKTKKATDLS